MTEKGTTKPPYTSFRSFNTLISDLRSHPVLPGVIDRHYLSKRSGSERAALIATLKWFGLVDDAGVPTSALTNYVAADEQSERKLLRDLVLNSYEFMSDGSVNLANATTSQMADRFRQYEISGSTLTKSVTFFLAAAKEAGIELSPHIKPPAAPAGAPAKKRAKNQSVQAPVAVADAKPVPSSSAIPSQKEGRIVIPIPIFGDHGTIELPAEMDERQWNSVIKMTEFILKNYRDTMASPMTTVNDEEPGE